MIQNVSDLLSILVLLSIPFGVLVTIILRLVKKRRTSIKQSDNIYYREW